jgi:hypothetical protein
MTLTKKHALLPCFGVFFIFLPVPASLPGFCHLDQGITSVMQGMGKKVRKVHVFPVATSLSIRTGVWSVFEGNNLIVLFADSRLPLA